MSKSIIPDIEKVVNVFKEDSKPLDRYSSFDYCYNYFLTTKDLNTDIEKSCLTLGFYLASWGMLRGSSFLLLKSVKYYQPVIGYIASLDKSLWNIDVDTYTDENIKTIIEIYDDIKSHLIQNGNADLTLVTKVILGIFGFVPAYDQYFCNTFRDIYKDQKCGFRKMNIKSLKCISAFYETNHVIIDKLSAETFTTDFITMEETKFHYPKAKIIDMYGFSKGLI